MKNEMIWFDRKFTFNLLPEMFPMVVERLRGTPARLEEKVGRLELEVLTGRDGDTWTILESTGHLLDVEQLWGARLDDFLAGEERLRPADLQNRRTDDADHNRTPVGSLLSSFRSTRERLVARLDELEMSDVKRTALHPRLEEEMRLIDSFYFAAEHDDHHLARISDLIGMFR